MTSETSNIGPTLVVQTSSEPSVLGKQSTALSLPVDAVRTLAFRSTWSSTLKVPYDAKREAIRTENLRANGLLGPTASTRQDLLM